MNPFWVSVSFVAASVCVPLALAAWVISRMSREAAKAEHLAEDVVALVSLGHSGRVLSRCAEVGGTLGRSSAELIEAACRGEAFPWTRVHDLAERLACPWSAVCLAALAQVSTPFVVFNCPVWVPRLGLPLWVRDTLLVLGTMGSAVVATIAVVLLIARRWNGARLTERALGQIVEAARALPPTAP